MRVCLFWGWVWRVWCYIHRRLGQIPLRAPFSTCCVINPVVEMVGMKPKEVVPSAAVKFFGAGTAACIADLVTFPLDTAKVRLQVRWTIVWEAYCVCLIKPPHILLRILQRHPFVQIQGEFQNVKGDNATRYRGVFGTITTMVRTEGPRSLYNGLVAGLQRQMSFASVRIGLYDSMKQFYTRGTESEFHNLKGGFSPKPPDLQTHLLPRCWDCDSTHGGLYHWGHGGGFCTTNRRGEGAFSSPGTTGWWWEEIQQHNGRLQDDCSRWGSARALERCLFILLQMEK